MTSESTVNKYFGTDKQRDSLVSSSRVSVTPNHKSEPWSKRVTPSRVLLITWRKQYVRQVVRPVRSLHLFYLYAFTFIATYCSG